MRKAFFVLFLLSYQLILAQTQVFFSPGFKFGYAFGEHGGFVFGAEASLNFNSSSLKEHNMYGAVISYEILNKERRLHLGAQVNFYSYGNVLGLLGLETGPTFIWEEKSMDVGFSITPYFGGFVIPYYRLFIIPKKYIQHEVGSFIKLHVPVNGRISLVD